MYKRIDITAIATFINGLLNNTWILVRYFVGYFVGYLFEYLLEYFLKYMFIRYYLNGIVWLAVLDIGARV